MLFRSNEYFRDIAIEEYSEVFDHVVSQYNKKQIKYLTNALPMFISEVLEDTQNANYLENKQQSVREELEDGGQDNDDYEETDGKKETRFKLPTRGTTKKPVVTEKIITKIEKEYINIIPDDYKKVAVLLGERKAGTSTITSLLALKFSKDKNVLVIDAAENGLFKMKSWGNEEVEVKDNYKELKLNENLIVIKPDNNKDILDLIEMYKYQNDIILIDGDLTFPINILKWIDMVIHIGTLDIMDVKNCKDYFSKAMLVGVNLSKVYLVINKHLKCKVSKNDIFTLYKEPIPYIEDENGGVAINDNLITIPFDEEFYRNSLSSYIYIEENSKCTEIIDKAIIELANAIYPVSRKRSRIGINLMNKLGIKF